MRDGSGDGVLGDLERLVFPAADGLQQIDVFYDFGCLSTLLPGRIAEDRTNCELIAKEEAAIQQLVLMALSENPVVVGQACKTIGED